MSDKKSSLVSSDALVKALRGATGRRDVDLLDDYRVERASNGVEGFTSFTFRVRVNYRLPGDDEVKPHVFFVKTMTQFEKHREDMKNLRVFVKEGLVFSEVVPLMAKVSAGRVKIPLPACYHCSYGGEDDDALYMEDLVHNGYRSARRSFLKDGLDYAHCSLVVKGLGRLHALSLAAEKTLDPAKGGWGRFPDFLRDYVYYTPGPGEVTPSVLNLVHSMIENVKDLAKEVEGLPRESEASGALGKVLAGVWPTLCRLKETPSHNRRVLIHGDCWMNNMMFRYEEGEKGEEVPVEVVFFDVQVAQVCHPCIDLLYFIFLNTRNPFRSKYIGALIDEYHSSLSENLMTLDGSTPPFSLDDLKSDINGDYKPFGYILCMLFTPVLLLEDDFLLPNVDDMTAEKMEEFFNTGNTPKIKLRFHNDPEFRSTVEDILREFIDMALPNGLESVNSSPLLKLADS